MADRTEHVGSNEAPKAAEAPLVERIGPKKGGAAAMTMPVFLDRLMWAESGGRLSARSPRSTALGPFQFIESTFLAVVRRHFQNDTANLTPQRILTLRTDLAFSRRAAEAYTRDNAIHLANAGIEPTYRNLRLAFLLGPAGAARVLKASPVAPVGKLLGPAVIAANPFMAVLTAHGLIARAARDLVIDQDNAAGLAVQPERLRAKDSTTSIVVRCSLRLASCRRWLALRQAKAGGTAAASSRRHRRSEKR